jgi:hypothetical protein
MLAEPSIEGLLVFELEDLGRINADGCHRRELSLHADGTYATY